jgi:hypothetical protein
MNRIRFIFNNKHQMFTKIRYHCLEIFATKLLKNVISFELRFLKPKKLWKFADYIFNVQWNSQKPNTIDE